VDVKNLCVAYMMLSLTACGANVTDKMLAAKIQQAYAGSQPSFTSVAIVKRVQTSQDSCRSPEDKGTTYVLRSHLVFSDGTAETRELRLFVADRDGWATIVRSRDEAVGPWQAKITIGMNDDVMYENGATRQEAVALGSALKAHGYFQDHGATVLLRKSPTTIGFMVNDGVWDDASMVERYANIARDVAPSAGGLPIMVCLLDSRFTVKNWQTIHLP
jgi:hypothetical protein